MSVTLAVVIGVPVLLLVITLIAAGRGDLVWMLTVLLVGLIMLVGILVFIVGGGFLAIWKLPEADAIFNGIGPWTVSIGPWAFRIGRWAVSIGPWDENGLRRGTAILAALVFVQGLGFESLPKHVKDVLPSAWIWQVLIVLIVVLTLFQYTALGGGQPLWAVEHVVVHLLEFIGVAPTDIEAFREVPHRYLAATKPAAWRGETASPRFLASNAALLVIALAVIVWSYFLGAMYRRVVERIVSFFVS